MTVGIHLDRALPDDPDLDALDCGVAEVDRYFRSRVWFDDRKGRASPATYQCRTGPGGLVVGYAAAAFRNQAHPTDDGFERARYLVLYALGVHRQFQGVRNPADRGRSHAATILVALEEMGRQRSDCVGLSLWVREDNARALAFYGRCGFVADPAGPVARDGGPRHLTLRLLFDR
ncbi:MAG: GNAT family N-acetyltransferase [Alphaproteobacteria bacterium]|nr:GNAT family N-acetyltransferase [Alphaproteobacteria bacterium]